MVAAARSSIAHVIDPFDTPPAKGFINEHASVPTVTDRDEGRFSFSIPGTAGNNTGSFIAILDPYALGDGYAGTDKNSGIAVWTSGTNSLMTSGPGDTTPDAHAVWTPAALLKDPQQQFGKKCVAGGMQIEYIGRTDDISGVIGGGCDTWWNIGITDQAGTNNKGWQPIDIDRLIEHEAMKDYPMAEHLSVRANYNPFIETGYLVPPLYETAAGSMPATGVYMGPTGGEAQKETWFRGLVVLYGYGLPCGQQFDLRYTATWEHAVRHSSPDYDNASKSNDSSTYILGADAFEFISKVNGIFDAHPVNVARGSESPGKKTAKDIFAGAYDWMWSAGKKAGHYAWDHRGQIAPVVGAAVGGLMGNPKAGYAVGSFIGQL